MADVHDRLSSSATPARVADVACGAGFSTLAIAAGLSEHAIVDGFDLDEASIELAQANLAESGLQDRVSFAVRDAADPRLAGNYDLVTIFEAIHDMAHPVEALGAVRPLLGPDGSVIVADERVAETFTAPGDDVERLIYGFSVLHCLPVGLVAQAPSAGTGTAMRPAHARRVRARRRLHATSRSSPIENDFWRFYRLNP